MDTHKTVWLSQEKAFVRVSIIDGKATPIVVLKSKLAEQYAGFRLIRKDLGIVKQIVERLRNTQFSEQDLLIKSSLSFYAVVTYGKCFTSSDGRGTRLDVPAALKYATADQAKAHDQVMKLRNEYVAHSELTGAEQAIVVAALNPLDPKSILDIYDTFVDLTDIDSILHDLEGLIDAEIKYVKEKYQKVHQLLKAEVNSHNINDLYRDAFDVSSLDNVPIKGIHK